MRRSPLLLVLTILIFVALACLRATPVAAQSTAQPVYLDLADSVVGSLDEITGELRTAFTGAGWDVLAAYSAGAEHRECGFGARVLVVHSPRYAQVVLSHGPAAAFAVPLRLVIFQDEAGSHVAVANPLSVNRTIVAEQGFDGESDSVLREISGIVSQAVHGTPGLRPYGQVRTRGYIGRTMGIMAGGPFLEKIETVAAVRGDSAEQLRRVADQVWRGVRQGGGHGRWQVAGVYRLDLVDQGVVIIGVSGAAMEERAFQIVGAGGDKSRRSFKCPGLAYGAAFPVEVVVMRDQGQIRVTLVDEMYRMKMYFEDAGKMKFALNMGMPGSIEQEIKDLVMAGGGEGR